MIDINKTKSFIEKFWDDTAIKTLSKFIEIPCKNQAFDNEWEKNGHLKSAANLISSWILEQKIPGSKVEVLTPEKRTPFVFAEIPGSPEINKTILFYAHLDKMPESEGWTDGREPWKAVLEGDRLYGRGSADNGSSTFISIAALKALQEQSIPHARCVFLLECDEESGSADLQYYIELLKDKIGKPDLVICLDGGGENYDQLWCNSSLRGSIIGTLRVEILKDAIHSGVASGIIPSTFRIARQLLSRVEDEKTGKMLLPELNVEIPQYWKEQIAKTAKIIGKSIYADLPLIDGCRPVSEDPAELLIGQTWNSTMAVIGAAGLPSIENAGNVIRPSTTLQINFRLPPSVDSAVAVKALRHAFTTDVPYGAKVDFITKSETNGWAMPDSNPWLKTTLEAAANDCFGNDIVYKGEGGSIGIIAMLADIYPQAQIFISGALVTSCGTHGPNEFLYIPLAKKLSCAVAQIIQEIA